GLWTCAVSSSLLEPCPRLRGEQLVGVGEMSFLRSLVSWRVKDVWKLPFEGRGLCSRFLPVLTEGAPLEVAESPCPPLFVVVTRGAAASPEGNSLPLVSPRARSREVRAGQTGSTDGSGPPRAPRFRCR